MRKTSRAWDGFTKPNGLLMRPVPRTTRNHATRDEPLRSLERRRSRPQTYNHARSHMLDCAVRRRALLPRELVRFRGRADGDPRVRRI